MIFPYLTSVIEAILTDDEILEIAIKDAAFGDANALGRIYDTVHKSVYGYALSILKNRHDAEDILHEVFIAIWQGASSYNSQKKPMAWIMTITRNLSLMKLRSHKRAAFTPIEDVISTLDDSEEATLEDKYILKECLLSLSDEEREIVTLHAVSGFRHREIAEMMGLPLATVLSKYARAIKKLKKLLTAGGFENEK